jgi:hypothetical protein
MVNHYYALYDTQAERYFFSALPDRTKKYFWKDPKWAIDAYATWVMETDDIEDREYMVGLIREFVARGLLKIIPFELISYPVGGKKRPGNTERQ